MKVGNLNVPESWHKMSHYGKCCYLVNTHQAKHFKRATELVAPPKKTENPTPQKTVRQIRLPYKDDTFDD